MSLITINNGTFDDDGTAEKVRTAFGKVKTMFGEIYGKIPLELPTGVEGYVIKVKSDRTGFELAALTGGGDMLSSNNLNDVENASDARNNLGLGSAATSASADFATSAQGTKADNALQSVVAGTGVSIDVTDPNNPIITNNETNDYVTAAAFAPDTGILTLTLLGTGAVTVDLSEHTVLKIDGFQVEKGAGNTDFTTIEAGDYCVGWNGNRYGAFKVNSLPYTTEANVSYAIDGEI